MSPAQQLLFRMAVRVGLRDKTLGDLLRCVNPDPAVPQWTNQLLNSRSVVTLRADASPRNRRGGPQRCGGPGATGHGRGYCERAQVALTSHHILWRFEGCLRWMFASVVGDVAHDCLFCFLLTNSAQYVGDTRTFTETL
jgi:hypothetical protein